MRTTITLDRDIAAAVEQLRREEGIGPSEALNRLARAGLSVPTKRQRFRQRTVDAGLLIDVSNVAEAIEIAEGPDHR
jgi:NOL1/NOP2/fmu family ribosome biogenesis protein